MDRTPITVFYSWQSDRPNATNRSFIERALTGAVKTIRGDDSIRVEPVLDRDTAGVPGSPEIAGTIFSKIDQTQVFVCDVSIINERPDGRPAPNPNVLVELGYALKSLGFGRIIMVLNDAFGGPELLPFDLRTRRVTRYTMPHETAERAGEPKRLQAILTEQLRAIITQIDLSDVERPAAAPTPAEQARDAIESGRVDHVALVRRYIDSLIAEITALTPTFADDDQARWDDQLVQAIERSGDVAVGFACVAQAISLMDAREAAQTMYKGFAGILDLYTLPPGFNGRFHESDFDLAKFLGHELFVTFVAALIREDRWELIATLLDEELYARRYHFDPPGLVPFTAISEHIRLLAERKERLRSNRLSLHADMLNERHTSGELGRLVPMEQFAEADYFLFPRAELPPTDTPDGMEWRAWGAIYMHEVPRYLVSAERTKYAQRLLPALGLDDIETLRRRITARAGRVNNLWPGGFVRDPMRNFNAQTLGSR